MMRARWFVACIGMILLTLGGMFVVMNARSWISASLEYLRYAYTLPSNVERRTAIIDDETVSFLIVHIDDTMTWGFANDPTSPRSVHEWRTDLDVDLVINGSYFTETHQSAGYYVLNGERNGVCPMLSSNSDIAFGYTFSVWIDDADHLEFGSTSSHPELCGGMDVAPPDTFASFPTLIYQNASMIEKDSELKAHRTMLAQTVDGEQYIVLTESGEVTLYDVAQWFLEQNEEYVIVGNLDGGPSTGLSMRGERWDIEVPSAAVPNVIFASSLRGE